MEQLLFRQAMRALVTTGLVVLVVSALVILPSFTVIGGLITLFLLASAYPLFLLGSYLFAGWHAAKHLGVVAAPLPRWRAALVLGGGGALTLTLMAALGGMTTGLAFSGFVGIIFANQSGRYTSERAGETFRSLLLFSFGVLGIYLVAGLIIGTLCAWGTAYWRLGRYLPDAPRASSDTPLPQIVHPE